MKALPVLALILIALGAAGYFLFGGGNGPTSLDTPISIDIEDPKETPSENLTSKQDPVVVENKNDGKTDEPIRTSNTERGTHPQGIEGMVLSSKGGVVRDAPVYVIEGISATNMINVLMRMAGGSRMPAKLVAEGRTDDRGVFRLPCPVTPVDTPYELRIAAPGHLHFVKKVRVQPERWEKLPPITIDKGRVLEGTVRDAVTKQPIVDAIVRVMPPDLNAIQPTPGLEDGYEAHTDTNGRYRFDGLPAGPFQMSAFAKGYGSYVKTDVALEDKVPPQTEDIELPKGFEISGFVVDEAGHGVPRARVEATPLSSMSPTPGSTFSNKDGSFSILGLTEGEFIVSAIASGFSKNERKPVSAGTKDVTIALEKQATVLVAVKNRLGRSVQTYTATLRRFFPENPEHYGNTEVQPVAARDRNGEVRLAGVDPGHYVVQVDASGYAKTFSKNFEVHEGAGEEVRVDVTLLDGGALFGVVVDSSGNGVANATVESLSVDYQDNPIFGIFGALQPKRITETNVSTDREGRFRLEKLTPASYQLRVVHPNFARGYFKSFDVIEGEKKDIGRLTLKAGVMVRGTVRVGTMPGVGVEVSMSRTKDINGQGTTTQVFAKAFSNEKGEWAIDRKLPEGFYEIQGARVDLPNPLMKIVDIQTSKREVRVVHGMPIVQIVIPNDQK
ncbi:MAG: carboxypeptidase regulatory-like domain-containing protein [Planctomycetes bacterium]|nr:carboxypeptidase regulatory-like domain-containing protein [Planctomycetota bacterium]